MDDIGVNNFNDVSCALFSELSKYQPEPIEQTSDFKSPSFGTMPRYIRFGGINSSVNTGNVLNINSVEKAICKYVGSINQLLEMEEANRTVFFNETFGNKNNTKYSNGLENNTNEV